MALTVLTTEALEGGFYPVTVAFTDEDGSAETPNADTIKWTLTDSSGTVINSRDNEAIASGSSVTIELDGDDLAVQTGETLALLERRLIVKWEYDSALGNGKMGRDECIFLLRNLTRIPVAL